MSAAVAELFKKAFPSAASDPEPEWFKQLKSAAGRTVKGSMKLTGPWDM